MVVGAGVSGFAAGLRAAAQRPDTLEERARKQIKFNESVTGQELFASNEKLTAAKEAQRFNRNKNRIASDIVGYFDNPDEKAAMERATKNMSNAQVTALQNETTLNDNFTGLIAIDPTKINLETFQPLQTGDYKYLKGSAIGENSIRYYYHNKNTMAGRIASVTSSFTNNVAQEQKKMRETFNVTTLTPEQEKEAQRITFDNFNPVEKELFTRQSVAFNEAIDSVIRTYKGSLIISDKTFLLRQKEYATKLQESTTDYDRIKAKADLEQIKRVHKRRQAEGYGYSEAQYRSELRAIFAKEVGALGLSDNKQIQYFMSGFLETEENQSKLLKRLISKYGMPTVKRSTVDQQVPSTDARNRRIQKVDNRIDD